MRVNRWLIYGNLVALSLNGIILGLMAAKMFPPILGVLLIAAFLAASVWLSCLANGKLPKRVPKYTFCAAPTEKVERF